MNSKPFSKIKERLLEISNIKTETSLTGEFINKPEILASILLDRERKNYKRTSYVGENGKTMITETYKFPHGGQAFLKFEEKLNPSETLMYCIDDFYPLFDKNVGAEIGSIKELAHQAGLARRATNTLLDTGEVTTKEIDSYDPRGLQRFIKRLEGGEQIILQLDNFKIRAIRKIRNRSGKEKRENFDVLISGSSSLLVKFQVGNKPYYRANPFVLAVAYGQTIEEIRRMENDPTIERISHQNFIVAAKHTPKERQQMKTPTKLVELEIDRSMYKLKKGKTTRTFDIMKKFRLFYVTKEDKEFRRNFKLTISVIKSRSGGEFLFTNQANGMGIKNSTKFMRYLTIDYRSYRPFLRKKEMNINKNSQASKTDATAYTN